MAPARIVVSLTPPGSSTLEGVRPFRPFRPGVEIAEPYEDANGARSALLRYAPGATVPKHRHDGFEQIYVLEGVQEDEQGTYPAGTLVVNPPGYEHSVASPKGCLVLITWQREVAFADASS